MIVAKLNIDHTTLIGQKIVAGNLFNPIQDAHGNWIVSIEESNHLNETDFELIEYSVIQSQDAFLNQEY
jgi:hypothetical protein